MPRTTDATEHFQGARMHGTFTLVAPGLVATRVHGHVDASAVRWYTSRVDRLLLDGTKVTTFHDWSAVDGFDADVRAPYRAWAERRVQLLEPPHFLVASKILSMALTVTRLVLGHELVVYDDRAAFEAALEAARAVRT